MKDQMIYAEKLSKMVQCETISVPDVPNTEKFDKFHKLLEELFPLVFSKGEVHYIDSSLLIKWKGKGKAEPILLMSHQDVVPAEGEWKYPPFSGEIKEDRIWGRGTVDTKGSLMCIFQSIEELMEEGYIPEGDVYIASSSTEEVAGSGAPKTVEWLKEHNVRLQFLMDEGGMIVDEPMAGVKGRYAMIGTMEKGTGNIKVIAHSTGGHASAPEKNTPIARLSAFINDIETKNPNKLEFTPTVLEMFKRLGPQAKGVLGFAMRHAKLLSPILKKVLPAVSAKGAAMLRTTMAWTMYSGSSARNVLPENAWVNINTRFIIHQGIEDTKKILQPYLEKYDLEAEYINCHEPQTPVDHNGKAFKTVEEVVREVYPGVIPSPYVMTGGTDAYYYAPVTDNAIRFAPIYIDSQQLGSIHAKDENMFVSSLPKAIEFYKAIIKKM